MAILGRESKAADCRAALEDADGIVISAGTLAEALIVATQRNVAPEMVRLVDGLGMEVIALDAAAAKQAAEAYGRWGKGVHPAGLNFGDCFAYALAQAHGCRLLFVGSDFARTDIDPVLPTNAA